MSARLIRFADLVPSPWKNGGGTTTEIAVEPREADFGSFGWRLSVAEIAADGPFSHFAGIDRTLTLIEGSGVTLDIDGEARLLEPFEPLCFAGEAAVSARLAGGAIRDFNVMTRRSSWRHEVKAVGVDFEETAASACVWFSDGTLEIAAGADHLRLGFGDTVIAVPGYVRHRSGNGLHVALTRVER